MTADTLKDWVNFFLAAAAASAALAGLVMVAISVNVQKIIAYRQLPARAGAAIAMLILILVTSMAALMRQPTGAFAGEVLVAGSACWLLQVFTARQVILGRVESGRPLPETIQAVVTGQLQVLPFLAGAVLLLSGSGDGLYWIAAGVMLVFIFSVLESWVLLVEILR